MSVSARIRLYFSIVILLLVTVLYPYLVYTPNAVIAYWREVYIETAMSTMTHQWLATCFFPQDMIDEIMAKRAQFEQEQKSLRSTWQLAKVEEPQQTTKDPVLAQFSQLDETLWTDFLSRNPEIAAAGGAFDLCDQDSGSSLLTRAGDPVAAIDPDAEICIVDISGEVQGLDYHGRLAIVSDPARVHLAPCANLFESGQRLYQIAEDQGAALAVNASGFIDPDGSGNGGTPYGLFKIDGEQLNGRFGRNYKVVGFDAQHRLQIGEEELVPLLCDAVEFGPALIVDGVSTLDEANTGFSLDPRTAIGQTADGTVLFLVIDGRSPQSIGANIYTCSEILERYGAVQASLLDGGSSSVMYFHGREITHPSTSTNNPHGRALPNAWIIK